MTGAGARSYYGRGDTRGHSLARMDGIAGIPRLTRGRLGWGAALALTGVCLFGCYLLQARTGGVSSDAASNALQASDMLHGNVLLTGWWLSDVSFYTTELPEYVLVEWLHGLRPDDVHICAALTYTLLVLTVALVARGPARGREGIVRAVLAGGIMVAPEIGESTNTLLGSPDHTGTGVPVMVTLLLLDRLRPRWYLPPLIFVLLSWVQVADQLATVAAAGPILLVGVVRTGLCLLPGRQGTSPAARVWYDLWLAVAAGASVPAAHQVLAVIRHHGGFYVHPLPGGLFASASALPHQGTVLGLCVLILFGADLAGQTPGLAMSFAALHIAGLAVAGAGLLAGLARFSARDADRVNQILVAGTLATLAAGWLGTHMSSGFSAHEIAVVLPLGAALAGRTLGGALARIRYAVPVSAVVLAAYLAALGFACTQPEPPTTNQPLASWLLAHRLTDGLGGYWQADSVTLDSGGKVTVAPIYGGSPYVWEAKAGWFDPDGNDANFVVMVSGPAAQAVFARPPVILRVFGQPAATYTFQQYTIMVWDKNLLTDLLPFGATG
jgi:hypothetical protein